MVRSVRARTVLAVLAMCGAFAQAAVAQTTGQPPRAEPSRAASPSASELSPHQLAQIDPQHSAALEVTVGGRPLLREAAGAPIAATSVISEEQLSEPGRSSADVLRAVPGVQVARSGAASDFATASLRGATSAQTPIYLAGLRLNDDLGGGADLSATPLWIVDRIEIYRGNAPEYADRLGVGGAIVFHPRLPRRTEFRLGGEVGSFGQRAQWLVASVASKKSAALLGVKMSAADNDYAYEDDRGTGFDLADDRVVRRRNADYQSVDVWALGRHRFGTTTLKTVFNAYERKQGINGFSVTPALHAHATQRRLLSGVTLEGRCAGDPKCRYELTTQGLVARSLTDDPRREISALLTRTQDVSGVRLSQRAALGYAVSEQLRLRSSLLYAWEETQLTRLETESLDASRSSLRPTLSADYDTPEVHLYGLAALECHATESSDGERAAGLCESPQAVGRLGVERALSTGVTALVTGGRYVRIPTVGEQFGTSPVVRGNDDLKVERSWGLDAGLRGEHCFESASVQAEVFGFARWTDDLIGYRLASLGIVRPLNVGRARNLGVETAAGFSAGNHLRLNASATFLDPRDQSEQRSVKNDVLPFRSRLVLAAGVEVYSDFPKLGLQRAHLGVDYFRRAARFADAAGLVVLPAEETLDVRAGARLWQSRLRLALTLRNAFDQKTQDLLGAPMPGRSIHAALEGVIDP